MNERRTFSGKNDMWKGKEMEIEAGLPSKKLCLVPSGNKMPATSHSNPQPLEMNGMVYERSTFCAKMIRKR